MGVINLAEVHTEPGKGEDHPFSPPPHWQGDQEGYRSLMRERWATNWEISQRIKAFARHYRREKVTFHGPWAEEAKSIIQSINQNSAGS